MPDPEYPDFDNDPLRAMAKGRPASNRYNHYGLNRLANPVEGVSWDISRYSDAEIRGLMEVLDKQAQGLLVTRRRRHAEALHGLMISLGDALKAREVKYEAIQSDTAMPPDWVTAIACLPLEDNQPMLDDPMLEDESNG
ncbi:hypothetical protein [Nonomuraea sp. NPDC049028]|uniref:hypothetical protein n=1 Tax=Nonomuraea sp. NPDC049028 TaxID=3364348 RepID=UPI003720040E